jgi:hypothetical protein
LNPDGTIFSGDTGAQRLDESGNVYHNGVLDSQYDPTTGLVGNLTKYPDNVTPLATPTPIAAPTAGTVTIPDAQKANITGLIGAAQNIAPVQAADSVKAGTPATYGTTDAAASTVNVDPSQTVEGRISALLKTGSPLQQVARADATEAANARGLVNSSMAVGAGERAVIESALPIASQDASIFANAAQTNAQLGTNVSQFNAGSKNTASAAQFQAQAQAEQNFAAAKNQAAQLKMQADQQSAIGNAAAANDLIKQANDITAKAEMDFAAAKNQASNLGAQLATQVNLANLDAQTRVATTNATIENAVKTANLDAQTRLNINKLDTASREKIAQAALDANETINDKNIEATAKTALQSAVTNAMGNFANAVNRIDTSPDLDATSKSAARSAAETVMHNSIIAAASVAGVTGIEALWAA